MSKRKYISISIVIVCALAIALVCFLVISNSSKDNGLDIKGDAAFPTLNVADLPQFGESGYIGEILKVDKLSIGTAKGMVYSVKNTSPDTKKADSIAKALSGEAIKDTSHKYPEFMYFFENGNMVEIDEVTGSFQYHTKTFADMTYEDEISHRLSDGEYIKRSIEFIKKHGINSPSLDITTPIVKPYMQVEITDDAGKDKQVDRLIGVYFHNKPIDNIVLEGVGPRLVFVFDNSGEIINVHSAWREFEKYKEYPLLSINELQEKLKQGEFTYSGDVNGDVTVGKIEIVYMPAPLGEVQEYLAPVYKLMGVDPQDMETCIYVQALKDKYYSIDDGTIRETNTKEE